MSAIDPGPMFRLLAAGEQIQNGDEFLIPPGLWMETTVPGETTIAGATYRRKVNQPQVAARKIKIVIEHHGVKRTIEGTGFNICGSPEDLHLIAAALSRVENFGWTQIRIPQRDEHDAGPNTEPRRWED